MAGAVFMRWTHLISNMTAFITPNFLLTKKNYIKGTENFWTQEKRHMRKFNGVPKAHLSAPWKLFVSISWAAKVYF